jgi:hypothetical protein
MRRMASLAMKKKVESRLRQLLEEDGLAQPNEIEYGADSLTLFWHSVQQSIVIEVSPRGEVGHSRPGPPHPFWARFNDGDAPRFSLIDTVCHRQAERDGRRMLRMGRLAQPDRVEYGYSCVRFFFEDSKVVLVIDLNDSPDGQDRHAQIAPVFERTRGDKAA